MTAGYEDGIPTIQIRDQGIGIPPDILANIFSSTKSTSRRGTQKETGTGFGMPLARSFVEVYGGAIEISSIEKINDCQDHGTVVKVKFASDQ